MALLSSTSWRRKSRGASGGGANGISRKLPDTERARLKRILKEVVPDDAGVIVRTAAENVVEEELSNDVLRLLRAFIGEDPSFAGELHELTGRCDDTDRCLEALLALLETWRMYVLASEGRDITLQRLQADLDAASTAMLVNGPGALA